jgi:hypothetical protein
MLTVFIYVGENKKRKRKEERRDKEKGREMRNGR